jgi:HAD superfamily hydrolase (TIGR01549 family)
MDGTLTRAVHDFEAIRQSLGLPPRLPILESLDQLPQAEAAIKRQQLEAIELELAKTATASDGAHELLALLSRRGVRLGIVTRNSYENVVVTLRAAGLADYFPAACVSTRDNAKPKPDPDGLLRLIEMFGFDPHEVAMVGDYLFDLECGRRAGACTVHYAADASRAWPEVTDLRVRCFAELMPHLE